jgi:predicted nucleic acid-binding protein
MRRYLLDAGALSYILTDSVPEKWARAWSEVRSERAWFILLEPVISEAYHKNTPRLGSRTCKDRILWLKTLPNVLIHQMSDNDALTAGDLRLRYPGKGLSMVDSLLLAVASVTRPRVLTTDPGVREVGSRMGIDVSYILHEA